MIATIILAGGIGSRFKSKTPKQFVGINNKTILDLSLQNLIDIPLINFIVVVIDFKYKKYLKNYPNIIVAKNGKTRAESCYNGLLALKNKNIKKVIITEAARPLISKKTYIKICKKIKNNNAVMVCGKPINSSCSLTGKFVSNFFRRKETYDILMPESFNFSILYDLLKKYRKIECTSFLELFHKIYPDSKIITTLSSTYENIKLTNPLDYIIIKKLYEKKL